MLVMLVMLAMLLMLMMLLILLLPILLLLPMLMPPAAASYSLLPNGLRSGLKYSVKDRADFAGSVKTCCWVGVMPDCSSV